MQNITYVTGHKNPDSDSICSAIAYSDFKNKMGQGSTIPIRLGNLNRETEFILNYFGVETPKLVETVKAQISDLKIDKVAPISPEISLKMAWTIMKKNNSKHLPVVNDEGKLLGLASISNLTTSYMDVWDNNILAKSNTKIENILDTLSAKCLYLHDENPTFKGKIVVAAMQPNSSKELIEENDVVICGNRKDAQSTIIESKASLMIVTGNHTVDDEILNKAKENGCSIISTPYDSFTTSRLIIQSIPISYIMTKDNIVSFKNYDFIEDIKDIMLKTRYRSYPVLDKNNIVVGSISRYHLISQRKKDVILVDHNEKTQSVDGLYDANIVEIIDHHRIADIQTGNPIRFRNEPVGSTATIVANIFFENGLRPSKKIAGVLCGAIISDTLLFKSPTATDTDKRTLKRLAEIANIVPEEFASEMFKAGTSLQGKTVNEIFNQDFKQFSLSGFKVGVGQVNTMDIEGFTPMKKDMVTLMENLCEKEDYNILILMLTDIIKNGSEIIVVGKDKDIVCSTFGVTLKDNSAYITGALSRKKQIIPPISSYIESNK